MNTEIKNMWRKKSWSIPDLLGSKSEYTKIVIGLIQQIASGNANGMDDFPKLEGVFEPRTWREYVPFLKGIGIVGNHNGSLCLSETGEWLHRNLSFYNIASVMQERFRIFGEILYVLDSEPSTVQEVDEKILQALLESDQIPERLAYYNEKIYHDSLTGAYNRRFFQEKMISVSKNTGIAMIDLDNFKAYNDTYGHHAGDLVLQTTVMTIKSVIRRDDILIRYGGDEFLLLMPGMQSQVFHQKLLQIHQFIYQSEVPEYGKMHVSASIGGVIAQGEEIEQAVERADKLMYAAKSQKSCVVTDVDEEVL